MKKKQISFCVLLACFILSCAACVWAWLCAIYLLFWGFVALPALFLQALIRRGGKEWTWLLFVHVIILVFAAGIGVFMLLLEESLTQLFGGLLLAIMGASALAGCLFELVIHLMFGKDERDEAQN